MIHNAAKFILINQDEIWIKKNKKSIAIRMTIENPTTTVNYFYFNLINLTYCPYNKHNKKSITSIQNPIIYL